MPCNRKGTITLTFSKRNRDVEDILAKKKESDLLFTATEYICECIRAYENQSQKLLVDYDLINKYIDDKIKKLKLVSVDNTGL